MSKRSLSDSARGGRVTATENGIELNCCRGWTVIDYYETGFGNHGWACGMDTIGEVQSALSDAGVEFEALTLWDNSYEDQAYAAYVLVRNRHLKRAYRALGLEKPTG